MKARPFSVQSVPNAVGSVCATVFSRPPWPSRRAGTARAIRRFRPTMNHQDGELAQNGAVRMVFVNSTELYYIEQ